jgi:hypothetical protein
MRKQITKKLRKELWNKFGYRCAYCGKFISLQRMQVDHIIPYARFYEIKADDITFHVHDEQNLNPSCAICNQWKGGWTVEEFRHDIEMQKQRLHQKSAGFRIARLYGLIKVIKNKKVKFFFEGGQNAKQI